ncbi:M24 family metallopeptidase [Ruegeria sp.]|uniref:M24 family metallopeptidase n=1 Tax=Ruegeria sp. TaxID=1879320 RepID=UPI003C7D48C0
MAHSDPAFSQAEYDHRLAKTRKAMSAKGIDCLFVEDPSNIGWLTGYEGWSFYVHQGALIFLDADPIWWGRRQDVNGALRTVWMSDDRIVGYADHFVQSTIHHPMQDLARLISESGHEKSRVGVELDNYYYSAKAHQTLLAELPNATLIDATALVNWQRAVKSNEEIALMRKAARISEHVVDGVLERVHPGLRKNELVAQIYHDAIAGVGDDWGDYAAIVPLLPSGSDAAAPHLTWNGDVFKSGECTFFELSGCYRRYHAPFCRSVFLGQPPDRVKRAEAALVEGLEAGLEAAKAGNRARDIAAALAAPLERAGIERGARCGYPIGLSYPPDWGERTISLRDEDETILEPGMTFHFMPGLWMDDWGLAITESILIKDSGPAECLCKRPREMYVKS